MNSAYSRLRISLLGSVAASIVVMGSASAAHAQAAGIAPSIEIHADVIESLRQDALMRAQAQPEAVPVLAPREEVVRQPVNRAPVAAPAPAASAPAPQPAPAPAISGGQTRWGAPAGIEMVAPPGASAAPNQPVPAYVAPRQPREVAPAPVVAAKPEVTAQEQAAQRWANRYPTPAGKPVPPVEAPKVEAPKSVAPKPVAPEPLAPLPLPKADEHQATIPLPAMESIPELPPEPAPLPPMKELPKPAAKAPEVKAPAKLPEPVALPPVKKGAEKAAIPAPAPMDLPPLEPLPEPKSLAPELPSLEPVPAKPQAKAPAPIELPPVKEPVKELPPLPAAKAPEAKAPLAPLDLPPLSKTDAPAPAAPEPLVADNKALQPPASVKAAQSGEGYGLMDDIKRLGRKMLGKEPEPMKPITTPIPVPTLPDAQGEPKASLKAMTPPPAANAEVADLPPLPEVNLEKPSALPAPVAIPPVKLEPKKETAAEKKAAEAAKKAEEKATRLAEEKAKKDAAAQEKAAKEAAKKEAAEKAKAEKEAEKLAKTEAKKEEAASKSAEEMAPLVLPPLPTENAKDATKTAAAPALPSELEPMPELAELPPLPSEKAAAKDEPKAAKPDPLAGLPPISSLDDDVKHKQAVPVASVTAEKSLPPLPPLEKVDAKSAAATKAAPAKKEVKGPQNEAVRSVKPTPVTVVGGSELPPIMDLPPLPSESASPLAPAKGPTPKSEALELIEKDGKKLAPEPVKELASLPAELPPLPALPDEASAKAEKAAPAEKPAAATGGAGTRVVFKKDALDIPSASEATLKSFAAQVVANPGKRVVIASYASGKGDEQARAARKIALSRGLKVRSYLIDQGVDALRINVSSKMDEGANNPDRVEVSLQ